MLLIDMLTEKYRLHEGEECACGYYQFFHDVFAISGYEGFDKTLARILIEGRGDRYSALVVTGPAGSGKTHFIISPLIMLLREKAFVLPSGEGYYFAFLYAARFIRLEPICGATQVYFRTHPVLQVLLVSLRTRAECTGFRT